MQRTGWLGFASLALLLAFGCSDPSGGNVGPGPGGAGGTTWQDGTARTDDGGDAVEPDAAAEVEVTAECTDCAPPAVCVDGWCVQAAPGGCTPEETGECYGLDALMTCDASGTAFVPVDCPASHICLEGVCKPNLCEPGKTYCEGLAATKDCDAEGTSFLEPVPCPEGQYCTSGKCTSTCQSDPKFGSYVGCAFWTVDLPNWPDPTIKPTTPEDLPHALVISNPNEMDAEITFEPPPGVTVEVDDPIVPGGQTRVFMMPVLNTDGTGIAHKGIRFESTRPILAHQFSPWKAIWSNDASLLLPEPFLGSDYVVLSWPTDPRGLIELPIPGMPEMENVNSFFTVLAPYDNTTVTFQVAARIKDGDGVTAMGPGGTQQVVLDRGEILNVEGEPDKLLEACDLTGSTVSADKPVMVFAGHESAGIAHPNPPDPETGSCCLDHLEEQMLPMHVLDKSYVAVKSKPRGHDPDLWRIIAAEDNVTLSTLPPLQGVDGVTLAAKGDWVEVYTEASFELEATGKVQVGQYLIGGQATDSYTGDPSLMLAVPSERYRDFYAVTVPPGYDTNWITIIKPTGAIVSTAAGPVDQGVFESFGTGAWEFTYLEMSDGFHKIAGDQPFGLIAYGYNGAMSYGYTGGMTDETN